MAYSDDLGTAFIGLGGSNLDAPLMRLLMCDAIVPGTQPGYETCKEIYTSHVLGGKMADGPVSIAQSQAREIAVQEAPPEVVEAFIREWEEMNADPIIHNYVSLSRVYGISSLVVIVDGQDPGAPLDVNKLADHDIWFNVLDPLNTSGSLVLNQIPTAKDFMKPVKVSVSGETYHPSRTQVMMNEAPIYINYVSSGFGFVGRSVYQRALFPLKSFVRCMILNDMIATKGGTIIAKTKQPDLTAAGLVPDRQAGGPQALALAPEARGRRALARTFRVDGLALGWARHRQIRLSAQAQQACDLIAQAHGARYRAPAVAAIGEDRRALAGRRSVQRGRVRPGWRGRERKRGGGHQGAGVNQGPESSHKSYPRSPVESCRARPSAPSDYPNSACVPWDRAQLDPE